MDDDRLAMDLQTDEDEDDWDVVEDGSGANGRLRAIE